MNDEEKTSLKSGSRQTEINPLIISLEYENTVNHAIQQNKIPVIKRILIHNRGEEHYQDAKLQITSDPEFFQSLEIIISSISPEETYTIHQVPIILSHYFFLNTVSPVEGVIKGEIIHRGNILGKNQFPLKILPYDHWNGLHSVPELLCAYITPNHPVIISILKNAQDILHSWTGNSSLSGYQTRDIGRVRVMAAGVYTALQGFQIRYATPEADFETEGQKIRLADQIIIDKMGSCLDLAILFAGCLEEAGLNPIIVITRGHAFVGVWLVDDIFSDVIIDNPLPLRKRVELDEITVLDIITVTSDRKISFDESVNRAKKYLMDDEEFHCAIDVRTSRNGRYHIIPIHIGSEYQKTAPDNGPLSEGEILSVHEEIIRDNKEGKDLIPDAEVLIPDKPAFFRLEKWMQDLLDLSLNNHLLNLKESANTIYLLAPDIAKLDDYLYSGNILKIKPYDLENKKETPQTLILNEELSSYLIEELGKTRIYSRLSEPELNKRLLNIYRQARRSLEEGGAGTLYLALGTLVWYESDLSKKPLYAPIILIPIEIERKNITTGFTIRSGDYEPRINTTLLEILKKEFLIEVPGVDPLPVDERGLDVDRIMHQFRITVKNLQRWEILNTATLAHFSFSKYLMWRDLESASDILMKNELVSHLVDPYLFPLPQTTGGFSETDEPDRHISPDQVFCPTGIDSSQLAAVMAAGEGKTFVLYGPPGTGKSQTITNIIGHCLATGKTVLFVSEKKVALDVVYSRLKECGLDNFCLELHSNKSHKKEVLFQFEQVLNACNQKSPKNWEESAWHLSAVRSELNEYVEVIHKVRITGESFFQGMSHLISLRDTEYIPLLWPPLSDISEETLREINALIHQYNIIVRQINPHESIWADARCSEWSVSWKNSIDQTLRSLQNSLEILTRLFPVICNYFGLEPDSQPILSMDKLADIIRLVIESDSVIQPTILIHSNHTSVRKKAELLISAGKSRDALKEDLYKRYKPGILNLDLVSLKEKLDLVNKAWFLKRKTLLREIRSAIQPYLRSPGSDIDLDSLCKDLNKIEELIKRDSEVESCQKFAVALFNPYWNDGNPDWTCLEEIIKRAELIRSIVSGFFKDQSECEQVLKNYSRIVKILLSDKNRETEIQGCFSRYGQTLKDYYRDRAIIKELLQIPKPELPDNSGALSFLESLLSTVQGWSAGTSQLKNWCQWNRIRKKAIERGFLPIVERYEEKEQNPDSFGNLILRSFYQYWVDGVRDEDPVLKTFFSPSFEDKIQEFRLVDSKYIALTKKEIEARLYARIPKGSGAGEGSEMGILRHQIQLSRRHMPIRSLFNNIRTILLKIKPCMLMSPISVAQYLDPGCVTFDLVVFDEASQIPVSDAIGVIARGRSTIIAGDPMQLPPSNIFQRINDDNEDDYEPSSVGLESILDECIASGIPGIHLKWHYRSRHESLIAFSNYHFYKNNLLTFPSPYNRHAIMLHKINGIYDAGNSRTNRTEAEALVKEIIRRLKNPLTSSDSIGVITFNTGQRDLIQNLLEKERHEHPEIEPFFSDDRSDMVFVKNLENVQGDERDTVLFSVGYGPDIFGKVSLNFGPLNRDGGERRLNVAITRARKEIVIFSSLRPEKIDLKRTQKKGVALLKSFLEYAEKGTKAIAEACSSGCGDCESPFEEEVCMALRGKGYTVHSQVGCGGYRIDIGVVDPDHQGRYLLGIECDGANYHRSRSARDRDLLRQQVLEQLGWRIHRIWSIDWWDDKEGELSRIEGVLSVARSEYNPSTMLVFESDEGGISEEYPDWCEQDMGVAPDEISSKENLSLTEYTTYPDQEILGTKEDFIKSSSDQEIIRVINEIVKYEGPVSLEICTDRLSARWQISRKTAQIKKKVEYLLSFCRVSPEQEEDKIFLWQSDVDPGKYTKFRTHKPGDKFQRSIEDISCREIANALLSVMNDEGRIRDEDLIRRTGGLFGIKRRGQVADGRIFQGINLLIEKGDAIREGNLLMVKPD